ncbi:hypothetical protein NPIL_45271 [Nephila pilipes]|uniref:Uncharacterized protein n=1 Tax=Nephila pilipes TaxID=299642 RepID=A0A8X6TRY0_NEPPI|nr:hypothetical protein NPIL_45271 [Nephila pilipes]
MTKHKKFVVQANKKKKQPEIAIQLLSKLQHRKPDSLQENSDFSSAHLAQAKELRFTSKGSCPAESHLIRREWIHLHHSEMLTLIPCLRVAMATG